MAQAILFPTMAGPTKSIYVETAIRGPLDRVWQLTQTPDLHQRWDLRFTEIRYLPRPDIAEPQRFLYATRIGFGLRIRGEGESVGNNEGAGGERSSALKFWSADPKSLIREGSGYWRYIPSGGDGCTVRFLTGYDYRVRFGIIGRLLDRTIFRPLLGWATAWSFDRLRLWIEKGLDPAALLRHSLIYFTARLALALVWLYEGFVPKLIFRHPDELTMLRSFGLFGAEARDWCVAIGLIEVAVGLTLIFAWHSRWPLWLTLVAMPAAVLAVAIQAPQFLAAPFNPVALNISIFAVAAIAWLAAHDLPSASRCLRRPTRSE